MHISLVARHAHPGAELGLDAQPRAYHGVARRHPRRRSPCCKRDRAGHRRQGRHVECGHGCRTQLLVLAPTARRSARTRPAPEHCSMPATPSRQSNCWPRPAVADRRMCSSEQSTAPARASSTRAPSCGRRDSCAEPLLHTNHFVNGAEETGALSQGAGTANNSEARYQRSVDVVAAQGVDSVDQVRSLLDDRDNAAFPICRAWAPSDTLPGVETGTVCAVLMRLADNEIDVRLGPDPSGAWQTHRV